MSEELKSVSLTRSEALVLFEWLASLELPEKPPKIDEAEQTVLWRIEGQLEKMLVEVVSPDYPNLVANAKRQVLAGRG